MVRHECQARNITWRREQSEAPLPAVKLKVPLKVDAENWKWPFPNNESHELVDNHPAS